MRFSLIAFCAVILFVSLAAFLSCGKRSVTNPESAGADSLSFDEISREIEAYEPPPSAGLNPDVFEQLRDELVNQLQARADILGVERIPASAPDGDAGRVKDLTYNEETGVLSWTYANVGDYDCSGEVGVPDITLIAQNYLAKTSDGIGDDALEAWIDGDGSGEVGVPDITPIANGYLDTVASYRILTSDSEDGEYSELGELVPLDLQAGEFPPRFSIQLASGAISWLAVEPVSIQGDAGTRSAISITSPPSISGVSHTTGVAGTLIQLSITVSGTLPLAYAWNFGGGATPDTSVDPSPSVMLGIEGEYSAFVIATNAYGTDTFYFTLSATQAEPAWIVFTGFNSWQSGDVGEVVQFNAFVQGSEPITYSWDFRDGATPSLSNEESPIVTLSSTGWRYRGTLTVTNIAGSHSVDFYYTVYAFEPSLIHKVIPISGFIGWHERFHAEYESYGNPTFLWNFGGGASPNTSMEPEPAVTLAETPGIYHANLLMANEAGTTSFDFDLMISVQNWQKEVVANEGDFERAACIAFDSNDQPCLSFITGSLDESRVKLAQFDGTSWDIEDVESGGGIAGSGTVLRYDSQNAPFILYCQSFELLKGSLKLARRGGINWDIETICDDASNHSDICLAIDSQDNPRLVYKQVLDSQPYKLIYSQWNGSVWLSEDVGGQNGADAKFALSLDSQDRPYIAYQAFYSGDLKCNYFDGFEWIKDTVDVQNDDNYSDDAISIAVDGFDCPHIGYTRQGDLKYARLSAAEWQVEKVCNFGNKESWLGTSISLSFNKLGLPTMAFAFTDNNSYPQSAEYKYAFWNGTEWRVDNVAYSDDTVSNCSLAFDAMGTPHIAYATFEHGGSFNSGLIHAWRE